MSARGIPVQDRLENQDPSVLYTVIEQTGQVVPLVVPEKPKPAKKAAAPKPPKKEAVDDGEPAEGDGE